MELLSLYPLKKQTVNGVNGPDNVEFVRDDLRRVKGNPTIVQLISNDVGVRRH